MREYTVVAWCDACPEETRNRSSQTFTVGITEGEERPTLHTIDLCVEHTAMMNAVAKLTVTAPLFVPAPGRPRLGTGSVSVSSAGAIAGGAMALQPRRRIVSQIEAAFVPEPEPELDLEPEPVVHMGRPPRGPVECPVCHHVSHTRGQLINHVWTVHRRGNGRPLAPTVCPDCGYASEARYVGIHRAAEHGYDSLAEVLAGVPGLEPEPEPEVVPASSHRERRKAPMDYCPICGDEMRRPSLVSHVWMKHRKGEVRPPYPTTCPDCGYHSPKKEQVGQHRSFKHGYDPVAEALAGVKVMSK